ncbi:hypothetical protein [Halalkalibacter okhensis]|uniref:hypothetical protein n=1 Tax=Halalkalibacter okhensis TaxID=333138 RepID=UPI001269CA5E|nr:hypothetical protein [Halalkalibacter okhensis]
MAITRCADCGSMDQVRTNGKECPYCERLLCVSCINKQRKVFSWNGCTKCCMDYRPLVHK